MVTNILVSNPKSYPWFRGSSFQRFRNYCKKGVKIADQSNPGTTTPTASLQNMKKDCQCQCQHQIDRQSCFFLNVNKLCFQLPDKFTKGWDKESIQKIWENKSVSQLKNRNKCLSPDWFTFLKFVITMKNKQKKMTCHIVKKCKKTCNIVTFHFHLIPWLYFL